MTRLTEREIEAAKQHPNSRARTSVVDRALRSLCVLYTIDQGTFVDPVSDDDRRELLYNVTLAMEVLNGTP